MWDLKQPMLLELVVYRMNHLMSFCQGPPDTPSITATSPMTEGMSTSLTCTADSGYPDDWRLVWSRADTGASLPGPTSTFITAADQRYSFTSILDYTPRRQDNGITIKCNAQRDSRTGPELEGSTDPLNVQYGSTVTNKADNEAGAMDGEDEMLTCIAEGNPAPTINWYTPSDALVISDSTKYTTRNMETSADKVVGYKVTGTLTIYAVDSEKDYGQYTCSAFNGIAEEDILKINLTLSRKPDSPTEVRSSEKTSDSITVSWTAGYDGGEDQWFIVSYLKTNSEDSEVFSDPITGGENMYTVTGLEGYTEYEVRVYAENKFGRNPNYGETRETITRKNQEVLQ
jgi:hypothetical protein